jgi:hypothetical protein
MVRLTPDLISGYGLDRNSIKKVQFFYESVTINADSSISKDEPTQFTRIGKNRWPVTVDSSEAKISDMDQGEMILLKSKTPCRVVAILEDGKVLRADFSDIQLDFRLSYRSGYTFELITDTVFYNGNPYVRSKIPLADNVGLLSVDRKTLSASEVVVKGKVVQE